MNIIDTMTDAQLFGHVFAGDTWANWRELLAGFYGLRSGQQTDTFRELTYRDPPESACNELWLVVGRRGGKSNIAALLAVYEATFKDHREMLSPGERATVMVIAADRKQARTVMRYIKGLLIENPMLSKMVVRDTEELIELSNRTNIEIMTASHRSTRGYTVAACIMDEVAFWYSEGANPDTEIIRAIRPSLTTLNGKLIALSSPYARRGALWETYKRHYGKNSPVLVAQAPSMLMNPALPPEIIKEAEREDPLSAAAEYGAQFRTDVESYVSIEAVEACTRPGPLEIMPASGCRYSAFVDPSGGVSDGFTICIVHKEDNCVVVDAVRSISPPFSPEAVVDEFSTLLHSYFIKSIKGDAYAGEWPREQFQKRGIVYYKSDKPKSALYQEFLPLLNSSRVELPPMQRLQDELIGLERRTSRGGKDSIDHAPGAHDDIANAVAGACVMENGPKWAMSINMGMAI